MKFTSVFYNQVKAELKRQHISIDEYKKFIGTNKVAEFEEGEASIQLLLATASFLGCSCDYLLATPGATADTTKDDIITGFTYGERIEGLISQLDDAQKWELFDIISGFCFEKGITFSRIDAQQKRNERFNSLADKLGKLGHRNEA